MASGCPADHHSSRPVCAIVGTVGYQLSSEQFRAMTRILAHRGPDAEGIHAEPDAAPPVWLGHRRLAIIDLSAAANQPFSRDGLVLIYNGEVYNYRELKSELEAIGTRFTTTSDTEVVLEGWRAWGPALLERLRGMFAFAVYEQVTGRLVLARDHFGIKPIFYRHDVAGQRLAFASELKALMRLPDARYEVDRSALASLLLYDWIPEEHCIYRGVAKVPPGAFMTFERDGTFRQERFWRPEAVLLGAAHRTTSVDELAEVVERSVEAHMVADVEVGAFLSGGLDSSLIVAMAAKRNPKIRCYTIGFRAVDQRLEAMPDDLRYARRLSCELGLSLHEIVISPDVSDVLPEIVGVLDEPIGDSAAINVLMMCRAARDAGIKVMLSGMGADEIFTGYRRHLACMLAARYRRLPGGVRNIADRIVARLPVAGGSRGYAGIRWAKRFLAFASLDEEAAYRRSYTYYAPSKLGLMLGENGRSVVEALCREHEAIYWAAGNKNRRGSQLERMCLTDLRMFLPALNLAYTDRASMAASVEVRVPFVDKVVLAAALGLHGSDRIRGRTQKYALRRLARSWLPREIIYRSKSSFGMPLRAWTTGHLRPVINDLLPTGRLVQDGYLDGGAVRELIRANEVGEADHAQAVWQLLALEHWLRRSAS
jgi:asparagine synthase (glutamine-hydrolysing)